MPSTYAKRTHPYLVVGLRSPRFLSPQDVLMPRFWKEERRHPQGINCFLPTDGPMIFPPNTLVLQVHELLFPYMGEQFQSIPIHRLQTWDSGLHAVGVSGLAYTTRPLKIVGIEDLQGAVLQIWKVAFASNLTDSKERVPRTSCNSLTAIIRIKAHGQRTDSCSLYEAHNTHIGLKSTKHRHDPLREHPSPHSAVRRRSCP